MAQTAAQAVEIDAAGSGNGRLLLTRHDQKIDADERQPAIELTQALDMVY
jgi:hypothetical protein